MAQRIMMECDGPGCSEEEKFDLDDDIEAAGWVEADGKAFCFGCVADQNFGEVEPLDFEHAA